jgi:hypothetical protein
MVGFGFGRFIHPYLLAHDIALIVGWSIVSEMCGRICSSDNRMIDGHLSGQRQPVLPCASSHSRDKVARVLERKLAKDSPARVVACDRCGLC